VTGWIAAAAAGVGPPGQLRAGTALVARGEFPRNAGLTSGPGSSRCSALAAAYVLATAPLGPVATRFGDAFDASALVRRSPGLGERGAG
jgi:CPA2 family monovalent cation:H+ antiporter-2